MAENFGNGDLRGKPNRKVENMRLKPDQPGSPESVRPVPEGNARANRAGWIAFAAGCMALLIVAVGAVMIYGVPGSTGGTSPSQQQTSGAPQPSMEVQDGKTRQNTTGYGSKENQPAQPAQ